MREWPTKKPKLKLVLQDRPTNWAPYIVIACFVVLGTAYAAKRHYERQTRHTCSGEVIR